MTLDAARQLDDLYRFQADALRNSLARKIGREDAEDIVGRAFVRLAEKLEQEPVKDGPALLGTIIAGLLKNFYRDRDAQRERELLVDPFELNDPDNLANLGVAAPATVEDIEFHYDFDLALRGLPEPERDAFILTELRGLSEREAADVLATSQPTVHRRAEAARNHIREELLAA